ncbi:MAG: 2-iminoacetate synthase ThiH [Verrucomicrobiota bacterium]
MPFSQIFQDDAPIQSPLLGRFQRLIAPLSSGALESMARDSRRQTEKYFGKTMRLFAPLYLSNECVNNCQYCGFSRDNPILRVTLSQEQIVREARHLSLEGFRHILLVAGEHPRFVSDGYLEKSIRSIKSFIPTVALEVGPMEAPEYAKMVAAGAEGLVVYQETYHRQTYSDLHTAGPKRKFDWRLDCPERAYQAGFRRIGIGALLGLADWRAEALSLAAHLEYLFKHCWKASLTISLPRLRPAAGEFQPRYSISDAEYLQLICAFRIIFPQVGIVLSTRESPSFRNALLPLGITSMSAGSHTEPGGYTGQGNDDLHLTVRGRRVDLEDNQSLCNQATEQFHIADERSPAEIAQHLRDQGFDPVWKDWDEAILSQEP